MFLCDVIGCVFRSPPCPYSQDGRVGTGRPVLGLPDPNAMPLTDHHTALVRLCIPLSHTVSVMGVTGVHLHHYVMVFTDASLATFGRTLVKGNIVLPQHITLLELTAVQNLAHLHHIVGWKNTSWWGQTTPTSTGGDLLEVCHISGSLNTGVGRMSMGELTLGGVKPLPGHGCSDLAMLWSTSGRSVRKQGECPVSSGPRTFRDLPSTLRN